MNDEVYALVIVSLLGHEEELAAAELDKLSRQDLDQFMERATREQIAREELRAMIVDRW